MVNEVLMYQSMFLLGIIAFGFFSFTFDTYSERASELSFESNIEVTTQQVGQVMMDLISQGRSMIDSSSSFEVSISIFTLAEYSDRIYEIRIDKNDVDEVTIVSSDLSGGKSVDASTFNTGIVNNTQIVFSSTTKLQSSSSNQAISYSWDGSTEFVSFIRN
ncbi:MAG: hypothetical protein ACW99A_05470 [Candidatus Kariarchaeaceae archaeon]|jgi:hypothetical protein